MKWVRKLGKWAMKWGRKLGKWAVMIYITQALVGIVVGVYLGVVYPEKVMEVLSCVAY